jgi:hypothetical protein
VITHVLNATSDMVFLMECADPVKVIVINVILLHRMTLNVLAHAKEAVMHAVMGIPAPDVDQDTPSIVESAMLAMVAANATMFKSLPTLGELNVLRSLPLPLLLLRLLPQHQLQLPLPHPPQIITMTTSPLSITAVVEQVICKCLSS